MQCTHFIFILFGIFLPAIYSRDIHFYRKDYTHMKEYDAFYKMHWDLTGHSWNSAFLTCDDEGATLFYPKANEEWTLVKTLRDKMTEAPNVTEIFVGIHDEFGLGEFITVDGYSTPYPLNIEVSHDPIQNKCITMNIETGAFKVDPCFRIPLLTPLPFVCKKVDDESCPTIDQDYKYSKVTKKCYKVNRRHKMWQEAMQTCFMEGAILVVVENEAEASVVRKMMMLFNKKHFVGVRRLFSLSDYYTITGQKFSEIYQNSYDNNDNFDCGVVYDDGNGILRTAVADCGTRLPFICEMDVA